MDGHDNLGATQGERINAGISSADSNFVAGLKLQNHRSDEIGKMNPNIDGVVLQQYASKRTVAAIIIALASVMFALFMPNVFLYQVFGLRLGASIAIKVGILVGGLWAARRIYRKSS